MSYNNRLEEKYIQAVAIDFLEDFYRKCSHNNKIVQYAEIQTITGNRADGLIVWESAPNDIRVVSIEAKAANTIRSLRTRWDKEKMNNWNRIASELLLLFLVCISFTYLKKHLVFEPALLVLIFLALHFIRQLTLPFLQTFFTPFLQTAGVFEQAAHYPGNEMWIAIGEDTFKLKKTEKLQALLTQCRLRKFGLLEIPIDGSSPIVLLAPKFRPTKKVNDLLSFYKKGPIIREEIYGETLNFLRKWRLSPAEKHYNSINLGISISITCFLFAFSFSNFGPLNVPAVKTDAYDSTTNHFSIPIPLPHPSSPIKPRSKRKEIVIETIPKIEQENAPSSCKMPFEGTKFILKDKLVNTIEEAEARIKLLREAGCPGCGYFWIPCSNWQEQQDLWCVFAYNDRNNKASIKKSEGNYQYKLRVAGLEVGELAIWKVGNR
ncbi:MAG: hypothetical protein AB8G86_13405 [Saprospiraceae bacterium]